MSVPKSKRKRSRFEVFHNMQRLQKELVKYLMLDFGVTRCTNLGEAQFLDLKFERIINLCADIVGDIHRANDLFVTNLLEDVQNSFKSWLGTYDKLLSYRTKSSMKALYTDLFER